MRSDVARVATLSIFGWSGKCGWLVTVIGWVFNMFASVNDSFPEFDSSAFGGFERVVL